MIIHTEQTGEYVVVRQDKWENTHQLEHWTRLYECADTQRQRKGDADRAGGTHKTYARCHNR